MKNLKIIKPDDWHIHFREGELLKKIVPETSKNYNRVIVMPNLNEPITHSSDAKTYKKFILKFSKNNLNFQPLMTLYLNQNIDINDLLESHKNQNIFAVKLYPAGVTTNSSKGISRIKDIYNILEKMTKNKIPLLVHGEVNDKKIDVFDREKVFIENELYPITQKFPELKITLEHITTKFAVNFINESKTSVKSSITPHHLILNRTDMLEHKIKPHYYCLPILKREEDRKALLEAAYNKNQKFFMGSDSAPHDIKDKESSCGCAGIFNTINSIQVLAQVFENNNQLDKLEKFISINGTLHYELPINKDMITLVRLDKPLCFREFLKVQDQRIKIFKPPFNVFWNLNDKN